jgi:hypothetical protein
MAALVNMVSDAKDTPEEEAKARSEMDACKLQVVEALSDFERDVPVTEHASCVHALMHLPDMIWWWNSLRNFWCYAGERFASHLPHFVHICHILYTFVTYISLMSYIHHMCHIVYD